MANKVAAGPTRQEAKGSLSQFRKRIRPSLRKIESWSLRSQKLGDRLRAYYHVGSELLSLNRTGAYSLAELKEVLGRGRRWQLEVRTFAQRYDKRQLQELCAQANIINWGHIRLVLWLPPKEREKWLGMSYQNRWGAHRFCRELKRRGVMGGAGGSRGGRPLGGSQKQPLLRLEQLTRMTEDWANLAQEVFNGRKDQALLQFQDFDEDFWNRLRKAMKSVVPFQENCEKLRKDPNGAIAKAMGHRASTAAERRSAETN